MRYAMRADELAVDIDRAAAHSGDHAGVLDLGSVQAHQDHVALRSGHVFSTPRISTSIASGLMPSNTV